MSAANNRRKCVITDRQGGTTTVLLTPREGGGESFDVATEDGVVLGRIDSLRERHIECYWHDHSRTIVRWRAFKPETIAPCTTARFQTAAIRDLLER